MAKVLIVDDEGKMRALVAMALDTEGYAVDEAGTAEDALTKIGTAAPDVIISDIRLPGKSGLELLRFVKEHSPGTEVIIMTAYADGRSGIEAMRFGAFEYVAKPFEMDHMLLLVQSAIEKNTLRKEIEKLRGAGQDPYRLERIVGGSKAMQTVIAQARLVADRDTTVLIRGPSGTGKELVARGIHAESRGAKPFVPVNCAALPENLLESELFGHEKGSFTGAHAQKLGLFEQAGDGTVFLDEVGEISPVLQVKLLRVLQEREFTRVGGSAVIKASARVIAATNRDLEEAVKAGGYREDLYYRLNVFPIVVPPLSSRREDVPALVEAFLLKYRHTGGISADALDRLVSYRWPGNVRELENCIERTVILAGRNRIEAEHLPDSVRDPSKGAAGRFVLPPEGLSLDEVEKGFIVQALDMAAGNKTRAAELLGISRRAIYSKMKTHGLAASEEQDGPSKG